MFRVALAPIALATFLGIGCGDSGGSESKPAPDEHNTALTPATAVTVHGGAGHEAPAPDTPRPKATGARIKVVDSEYGRVVADGKGEALYLFDRETDKRPQCRGACALAWPPALTKGTPIAGGGTEADLLGTTRRADGKLQITYAGHPLYYYVSDSPGTILCQDVDEFGGTWLVVKPSGAPVR